MRRWGDERLTSRQRCCSDRLVLRVWKITFTVSMLVWALIYFRQLRQPVRTGGCVSPASWESGPTLEAKWLPCSVSSASLSPGVLHFVTPFARRPDTTAQLIRTAQTLAHAPPGAVHWVLLEVASPGAPRQCAPGVAKVLGPANITYTYIVQGVEKRWRTRNRCLEDGAVFRHGGASAASHLAQDGADGVVHVGRLDAAYPTTFFEEVLVRTKRVSTFPSVVLSNRQTEMFSPVLGTDGRVKGFAGNTSSAFFPLSLAFTADYLRDRGVDGMRGAGAIWRRLLDGRHLLGEETESLDEERTLCYHVRARERSQWANLRPPEAMAGEDFNLRGLLGDMLTLGIVRRADQGGRKMKCFRNEDC